MLVLVRKENRLSPNPIKERERGVAPFPSRASIREEGKKRGGSMKTFAPPT